MYLHPEDGEAPAERTVGTRIRPCDDSSHLTSKKFVSYKESDKHDIIFRKGIHLQSGTKGAWGRGGKIRGIHFCEATNGAPTSSSNLRNREFPDRG